MCGHIHFCPEECGQRCCLVAPPGFAPLRGAILLPFWGGEVLPWPSAEPPRSSSSWDSLPVLFHSQTSAKMAM